MWKTVVHNLLYFMHDLLPAAYNHGNWTKEGVDRAVSWGAYCEKIVNQSSQNETMQIAFLRMVEKYDWILSFQQLKSARKHLLRLLMQNQLLDVDVKHHINQKAQEVLGTVITDEICKEVRQQEDCHQQLMNILSKNKKKECLIIQTRFLLEAGNNFSSEQLSPHLKQIVMSPNGLEVLLDVVISHRSGSSISKSSVIVITWLEGVLRLQEGSTYESVLSQLISLPSKLLCGILVMNRSLHSLLLSSLKREAKYLKPCYSNGHCTWVTIEDKKCLLKYEDLVSIYRALQGDENIAVSTRAKVFDWCLEDGGMVWNTVRSDSGGQKIECA